MNNTIYEHAPKRGWVPRNVDTVLCQKVLGTIIKPKRLRLIMVLLRGGSHDDRRFKATMNLKLMGLDHRHP